MNAWQRAVDFISLTQSNAKHHAPIRKHVIKKFLFVAFIGFYFNSNFTQAVEVTDLYQAKMPVNTQNFDEVQKVQKAALEKVIKKVTGLKDISDIQGIESLLSQSNSLVLQSAFETNNEPLLYGSAPYLAVISFNELSVNQKLESLAEPLPIWSKNRPEILLWLAVESEGQRLILGQKNPLDNVLLSSFASHANKHGIPLRLPLVDVEDLSVLHPIDVWGLFLIPIEDASLRYPHDMILTGRLENNEGKFSAKLVLKQNKSVKYFEYSEIDNQDLLISQLIEDVTQALSEKFAIIGGLQGENAISVQVGPMLDAIEYANMLSYLESLKIVKSVQIISMKDRVVTMNLELAGSINTFKHYLGLDKKLVEDAFMYSGGFENSGTDKVYRFKWISDF